MLGTLFGQAKAPQHMIGHRRDIGVKVIITQVVALQTFTVPLLTDVGEELHRSQAHVPR